MKKKTCASCDQELPIKHFGISRSRNDGRSPYCKPCNLLKTNECRARKRAYKSRLEANGTVQRKATITRRERKLRRVEQAINDGYGEWNALMQRTRLKDEALGLLLVDLIFDKRSIRPRTIDGQRVYVRRAA